MTAHPIVLITGAGRGIGAATAKLAAARGYDVAVNYKSDAASAADVVDAVKAQGRNAVAIAADMAVEADIERMFKTVDEKLGRLTHFVYNTGIPGRAGRLGRRRPRHDARGDRGQRARRAVVMQHAIRRMSTKHGGQGGAIVLLSSVAADIGGANEYVWYAASKGAIEFDDLRPEQGTRRRRHPGQLRVARRQRNPHPCRLPAQPDKLQRIGPLIPMGRVGKPEESARSRTVPALGCGLLYQRHGAARCRRTMTRHAAVCQRIGSCSARAASAILRRRP